MSRDRQRRNRREKDKRELLESFMKSEKNERPWLNHEGYHDLTSYHAIRNVERERKNFTLQVVLKESNTKIN